MLITGSFTRTGSGTSGMMIPPKICGGITRPGSWFSRVIRMHRVARLAHTRGVVQLLLIIRRTRYREVQQWLHHESN